MSNKPLWQPSAKIALLKQRAIILQTIRQFFADKQVMEVETPSLSRAGVTDPYLYSFSTSYTNKSLFLQTSPEFHMKRLLCAGSGPIYQICKAFRDEESGRYHNPEFTILEWYQPGYDHFDLMNEVSDLLQQVLKCKKPIQLSYQQAFQDHLALDPLTADISELKTCIQTHNIGEWLLNETDKDTILQQLFSLAIEPKIGQERPCFIYNFPASQASLAKLDPNDKRVAQRFELYYRGLELVNGFNELTDAKEQQQRFEEDNRKRHSLNRPQAIIDYQLLQALQSGLPSCSGVALGVDRLVMLALQSAHINEVIAFPVDRA